MKTTTIGRVTKACLALLLLNHVSTSVDSFQLIPTTRGARVCRGRRENNVMVPSSNLSLMLRPTTTTTTTRADGSLLFRLQAASSLPDIQTNVELPLLDLAATTATESSSADSVMIQPLPSYHLPPELRTLSIYSMDLKAPLHRIIVERSLENESNMFGLVVSSSTPLMVGSIGCAAQVHPASLPALLAAKDEDNDGDNNDKPSASKKILCQGTFRFVVKEVLQEIPYPVVLVDELVDDDDADDDDAPAGDTVLEQQDDEEEDDDEDDSSMYRTLTNEQLVERTLGTLEEYCRKQLEDTERDMSPLEKAILVDSDLAMAPLAQRNAAEEMNAVLQVFRSTLNDLFTEPKARYYAVAVMAAEMSLKNNDIRRHVLQLTNGRERLLHVLAELDKVVGMERARKMATQITDTTDEASKDLKVGEPQLPPWARSIQKGTKLEYYWNEEYGWCTGEVVEEPFLVVDEILLTVYFDDDGTTHRLPFRADEKVRWRPLL